LVVGGPVAAAAAIIDPLAPTTDFFDNLRPPGLSTVGAVQFMGAAGGTASAVAASLAPTLWSPTQTRNCPGTSLAQILACGLDPVQLFTLTNTGTTTLTGVGQGVLGGTNAADFVIVPLSSTCGPASAGQLIATTTLAPGASCVVTVQFKPLTSLPTGGQNGTVSVTDSAGTQTSTLTGTAN
jgi:hypothetical protein